MIGLPKNISKKIEGCQMQIKLKLFKKITIHQAITKDNQKRWSSLKARLPNKCPNLKNLNNRSRSATIHKNCLPYPFQHNL